MTFSLLFLVYGTVPPSYVSSFAILPVLNSADKDGI
jgi:hypothetical protein